MDLCCAKRLKALREESGLTQEKAAAALGITPGRYAKYEQGVGRMLLKHLVTICVYYGVSADYVLGLTDRRKG